MKKIALLALAFVLGNTIASAQLRKFVWEDEICAYEGRYNASLYTKKQLENTYQMWYSPDFVNDAYELGHSNSQGLWERWTIAELDADYAQKSSALKNLEVVNVPFWKALKQKKLQTMEQSYKLA